MGLEDLQHNFLTGQLEDLVRWARRASVWPASTGGLFNNYAIVQGVDQIVPVDVYAPGCPPSPETLMHAILTLHEQIRTGEIMQRRSEGRPTHVEDAQNLWTPEVPVAVRVGTPK